jgi:hypothetical protein
MDLMSCHVSLLDLTKYATGTTFSLRSVKTCSSNLIKIIRKK